MECVAWIKLAAWRSSVPPFVTIYGRLDPVMSIYAIGDVQGCWDQVTRLIESLPNQSDSELIFVGDLVNRGPKSLDTLLGIHALGARARVVLGNHDLHLLAVAQGIRKAHRSDTLDEILHSSERDILLDWLRQQPLALEEGRHLIVHAGVLPQWTRKQTLALANEVHQYLAGPDWMDFLREMYGNQPARWSDDLEGNDRLRCIVNALTRLRFCTEDGHMDFSSTESSSNPPPGCLPWFEIAGRATRNTPIVFGHWSTLGLTLDQNVVGIDTGCVWGGKLTAVRLSDHAVFQISCPQQQRPG